MPLLNMILSLKMAQFVTAVLKSFKVTIFPNIYTLTLFLKTERIFSNHLKEEHYRNSYANFIISFQYKIHEFLMKNFYTKCYKCFGEKTFLNRDSKSFALKIGAVKHR